jgi:hypothetical protein
MFVLNATGKLSAVKVSKLESIYELEDGTVFCGDCGLYVYACGS